VETGWKARPELDFRMGAGPPAGSYPAVMRRIGTRMMLLVAAALAIASAAAAQPANAPTLALSASAIEFGSTITLHGTSADASAGQDVQILSQACGFSGSVPVGTAKTKAGGAYSFTVQPMLNSAFQVQVGTATSNALRVTVRPLVQIRRLGAGQFRVDVSVANGAFFTGATTLQRYDVRTKSWKPAGSASLKANSDPQDLTAVSSATVRVAVARGTRVRAAVSQATVGSCYRPAVSASVTA
jgi:hypothetical protein